MQQSLFDQEHVDLLQRIDKTIRRLALCYEQTPGVIVAIANMQYKRALVEQNNYIVRQVNEELVSAVGAEIGRLTQTTGLRNVRLTRDRKTNHRK